MGSNELLEFPSREPASGGRTPSEPSIEELLDPRLDTDTALALGRRLASEEPLLGVLLVRRMFDGCKGDIRALEPGATLRLLALLEAISDVSRVPSSLTPLLRHPSEQVRSKLALMLGRHNPNLSRVKSFLACHDGRIRANAVESLWGRHDVETRALLWEAAKDPNSRVMVNALLGLFWAGEGEVFSRLMELAASEDPIRRAGSAWAMGQTRDPVFAQVLATLCEDPVETVRLLAANSRSGLRVPEF